VEEREGGKRAIVREVERETEGARKREGGGKGGGERERERRMPAHRTRGKNIGVSF